jgi:Transposase DDE domain
LVAAALVWAWSQELTLLDRFVAARSIITSVFAVQHELAGSYQAFTKMLARWSGLLQFALLEHFQQRMQEDLPSWLSFAGRPVFGVDGTRLELPRSRANESELAPQKRLHKRRRKSGAARKKAQQPSVWLTVLWHARSCLPWSWRSGPADASEREHLAQMTDCLPPRSIVTADAGYVGYTYWQALLNAGHDFVIRVGSNVKLLRKLGYARERGGLVYLWTDRAAAQQEPPLVLRLVVFQGERHPVYLVSSLLDARQTPDQILLELYRQRWGVEVFHRGLKQTFGRRKLRSQTPGHVHLEVAWSLFALWAICLLAEYHQQRHGKSAKPVSLAGVLRVIRRALREYACPCRLRLDLLLAGAVLDGYERTCKDSRDYPRKKRERPPGPPKLVPATMEQILLAQRLKRATRRKG